MPELSGADIPAGIEAGGLLIFLQLSAALIRLPDPASAVLIVKEAVYVLLGGPEAVADVVSCPVFGSNDIFQFGACDHRHQRERRIGKDQVSRVFHGDIVLSDIEVVTLIFRKHLAGSLLILRDNHKAHVGIDLFHVCNGVKPIAPVKVELRVPGIFSAPHVDDAEVIRRIFAGFVFGLHLQPFPDFLNMSAKITLVLKISVQKRLIADSVYTFICAADVAAVRHVMVGIAHEEAVILLVKTGIVFHFGSWNLRPEIEIHKIHALVGLGNVADLLRIDGSEIIAEVLRDAACGDEKEKLIPESEPGDEFYADHA